ncbi:MAG: hypothetical protein ACRC5M_01650 [Anaeroplasmataceae bacterium]
MKKISLLIIAVVSLLLFVSCSQSAPEMDNTSFSLPIAKKWLGTLNDGDKPNSELYNDAAINSESINSNQTRHEVFLPKNINDMIRVVFDDVSAIDNPKTKLYSSYSSTSNLPTSNYQSILEILNSDKTGQTDDILSGLNPKYNSQDVLTQEIELSDDFINSKEKKYLGKVLMPVKVVYYIKEKGMLYTYVLVPIYSTLIYQAEGHTNDEILDTLKTEGKEVTLVLDGNRVTDLK